MVAHDSSHFIGLDQAHVMPTYGRFPAVMVRGAGTRLWDAEGRRYLDLLAGVAVCQLGHCHPAVVEAIVRQASTLMHCSNLLLSPPVAELGAKLCDLSGMERAFFAVCGATANEAALKIAKKHGNSKTSEGDYEILALEKSFHGRTLGVLSATGTAAYREPFAPLIPGFRHLPANDLEALRAAFSEKTAAIILEPIQGEGGVWPLSAEYLAEARRLCDAHNALLIFDEVQTGMGRTGTWFGFQHSGVVPDVITLAKGLGSGMPIGACLARGQAADLLGPGSHGSTFGGNPLMCAVGLAVIETIEREGLLARVKSVGDYFKQKLSTLSPKLENVRGEGLMLGVTVAEGISAKAVVKDLFVRGVVANAPSDRDLRFVPPLILTESEVDEAISHLAAVLGLEVAATVKAFAAAETFAKGRDFLAIDDLTPGEALDLLNLAHELKHRRKRGLPSVPSVEGRTVAMVFEKPSLRTRVTFEAAIQELGGHPIYLSRADIGMGTREAVKDVASNLGRWCGAVVARLFWHRHLLELAEHCETPVVNALTELEHPCQAMADLLTIRERFGDEPVPITYVGDGNNVARSLAKVAKLLGYPFTIVGPDNFRLEEMDGIRQTASLEEGLPGSKVVYTDVWISMGDEREQEHRLKIFADYQVNDRVMAMADRDAIFMHCLPAHRGYEVTDSVVDSVQSVVVDQAENRLHAQKALLQRVLVG